MSRGEGFADFAVTNKLDSFLLQDFDPAHHNLLLVELHIRDAIGEQAARSIGAFEDRDPMSGAVELGRGAEAGRPGTDDGGLFSSAYSWRFWSDPAFLPGLVDDGTLDVLDCDGRGVDAENTGAFARSRADSASELGEIVRLVEPVERLAPKAAINQIVPFGYQVVDGAS